MPDSQSPEDKIASIQKALFGNRGAYSDKELERLESELALLQAGFALPRDVDGAMFD